MNGHRPNPIPILSQSLPPCSPSSPLIHPAVTQTSSDTSSPNRRPSYKPETGDKTDVHVHVSFKYIVFSTLVVLIKLHVHMLT